MTTQTFKVGTLVCFDAGENSPLHRVTETYDSHFIYQSLGRRPVEEAYIYSGGGTASVATTEQINNFISNHNEMINRRINELETLNTTLALVRDLSSRMENNNEVNL